MDLLYSYLYSISISSLFHISIALILLIHAELIQITCFGHPKSILSFYPSHHNNP